MKTETTACDHCNATIDTQREEIRMGPTPRRAADVLTFQFIPSTASQFCGYTAHACSTKCLRALLDKHDDGTLTALARS